MVTNQVSPSAKLGANVKIWHFSYVGDGTEIGDNTKIGSLVHIDYNVKIGERCKIEGAAYIPPLTRIGDDVFIGPGVIFTNDPYPLSDRMVGITVEDGARICAGAVLSPGVRIGKNAVVGMGSVVTRDVPAGCVVYGNPAKPRYPVSDYEEKRRKWNEPS